MPCIDAFAELIGRKISVVLVEDMPTEKNLSVSAASMEWSINWQKSDSVTIVAMKDRVAHDKAAVKARLSDGTETILHMEIFLDPCEIKTSLPNGIGERFQSTDLFECMRKLRLRLEKEACQALCVGARVDAWPSGMSRDMSQGRKVYICEIGRRASRESLADLFDYAPYDEVGTVAQQMAYQRRWIESLGSKRVISEPD